MIVVKKVKKMLMNCPIREIDLGFGYKDEDSDAILTLKQNLMNLKVMQVLTLKQNLMNLKVLKIVQNQKILKIRTYQWNYLMKNSLLMMKIL